jgi:hypothetical protein
MAAGFVNRRDVTALLGGAAAWAVCAGSPDLATAQVKCETIPAGPARTDCYVGLSRIHRQESEFAAGTARQQTSAANYRNVTGRSAKKSAKKIRRKKPAR